MNEKPRSTKESLFSKDLMLEVLIFGISIASIIFNVWKYLMDNNTNIFIARSTIMLIMVFIQNIHVLNCRSEKNSIFTTPLLSNPLILITIIGSILLQIIVMNIPTLSLYLKIKNLPLNIIILSFIISLLILLISEVYKLIYRKFNYKMYKKENKV